MSKTLRYQQPAVKQHLAQQYALNHLTDLSASRLKTLMNNDPDLKKLVYLWQEKLVVIVDAIPEQHPPKAVWNALSTQHNFALKTQQKNQWLTWLWPSAFSFALGALIIVSMQFYQSPTINTQLSPSYMAVMNKANDSTRFVINAYLGLTPGNSKLKIQWDKNANPDDLTGLTLWSIARNTGKTQKIDNIDVLSNPQHLLSKEHWLQIKNSEFLEIRRANNVVYRGECIQLASWNI